MSYNAIPVEGSLVDALMSALNDEVLSDETRAVARAVETADSIVAEWTPTGGGCYAVEVELANGRYLLVTDFEGPFTAHDAEHDDDVAGWYVGMYEADGSPVEELDGGQYVYASYVDDDGYTPRSDIGEVVAAVRAEVVAAINEVAR